MGSFDALNKEIQDHILRNVMAPSKIEDSEANRDSMADYWMEKEKAFTTQLKDLGMDEVESLEQEDHRGILGLTYSGSLIGIGPLEDGKRQVIYSSIGMRKDVPDQAVSDESNLDGELAVGKEAFFTGGPIKKSSPLYKLAVVQEALSIEDQRETISEATRIITEEFVDLNKTVILD
ncbi:MAG: hypothetical protein PF447_00855 [Spirochaetaceae bacterium]|jgi:hypothetical protein|nr:hypothetical protein [Spirochaetaceae bacterium]